MMTATIVLVVVFDSGGCGAGGGLCFKSFVFFQLHMYRHIVYERVSPSLLSYEVNCNTNCCHLAYRVALWHGLYVCAY